MLVPHICWAKIAWKIVDSSCFYSSKLILVCVICILSVDLTSHATEDRTHCRIHWIFTQIFEMNLSENCTHTHTQKRTRNSAYACHKNWKGEEREGSKASQNGFSSAHTHTWFEYLNTTTTAMKARVLAFYCFRIIARLPWRTEYFVENLFLSFRFLLFSFFTFSFVNFYALHNIYFILSCSSLLNCEPEPVCVRRKPFESAHMGPNGIHIRLNAHRNSKQLSSVLTEASHCRCQPTNQPPHHHEPALPFTVFFPKNVYFGISKRWLEWDTNSEQNCECCVPRFPSDNETRTRQTRRIPDAHI